MTASQSEWPHVLWFSATLLSLAVALLEFGRILGGRWVVRLASIAGAGIGLSSVANIFEDGFRIDGFFFAFILGSLILDVTPAGALDRHRTHISRSIQTLRTHPGVDPGRNPPLRRGGRSHHAGHLARSGRSSRDIRMGRDPRSAHNALKQRFGSGFADVQPCRILRVDRRLSARSGSLPSRPSNVVRSFAQLRPPPVRL
jgi:hypothetical protein